MTFPVMSRALVRREERDDISDLARFGDVYQIRPIGDLPPDVIRNPAGVGHWLVDDVRRNPQAGQLERCRHGVVHQRGLGGAIRAIRIARLRTGEYYWGR